MEDRFLEPANDEPVDVVSPDDQMPSLAQYITGKFEDAENGRFAYVASMIPQLNTVTVKSLKYL